MLTYAEKLGGNFRFECPMSKKYNNLRIKALWGFLNSSIRCVREKSKKNGDFFLLNMPYTYIYVYWTHFLPSPVASCNTKRTKSNHAIGYHKWSFKKNDVFFKKGYTQITHAVTKYSSDILVCSTRTKHY